MVGEVRSVFRKGKVGENVVLFRDVAEKVTVVGREVTVVGREVTVLGREVTVVARENASYWI